MNETVITNTTSSRLAAINNNYSDTASNLFPQSFWADTYYFRTKENEPIVIDRHISKLYLYNQFYNTVVIKPEPINYRFYLNDAIRRYKELNSGSEPDVEKAKSFLDSVKELATALSLTPYIMFNKFSVNVVIVFNDKEITLDYDYEDTDIVSALYQEKGTLKVRETRLDKLEETIRLI
jgi:hypothetical protein